MTTATRPKLRPTAERAANPPWTQVRVKIGTGRGAQGGSTVVGPQVLDGFSIGDSPFFARARTFRDAHWDDPEIGFVDRKFQCPDGRLRIGFSPQAPTTPSDGRVARGTSLAALASSAGLQGDGQMRNQASPAPHPGHRRACDASRGRVRRCSSSSERQPGRAGRDFLGLVPCAPSRCAAKNVVSSGVRGGHVAGERGDREARA